MTNGTQNSLNFLLILDRDTNSELRRTQTQKYTETRWTACPLLRGKQTLTKYESLIDSRFHQHFTVRETPQISRQIHQQQFLLLSNHTCSGHCYLGTTPLLSQLPHTWEVLYLLCTLNSARSQSQLLAAGLYLFTKWGLTGSWTARGDLQL